MGSVPRENLLLRTIARWILGKVGQHGQDCATQRPEADVHVKHGVSSCSSGSPDAGSQAAQVAAALHFEVQLSSGIPVAFVHVCATHQDPGLVPRRWTWTQFSRLDGNRNIWLRDSGGRHEQGRRKRLARVLRRAIKFLTSPLVITGLRRAGPLRPAISNIRPGIPGAPQIRIRRKICSSSPLVVPVLTIRPEIAYLVSRWTPCSATDRKPFQKRFEESGNGIPFFERALMFQAIDHAGAVSPIVQTVPN